MLASRPNADLSGDTLWSTQQPCAMCAAAIRFCKLAHTRYLAVDPAFLGKSDPRAGVVADPTRADPTLAPWGALANAIFLWPTINRAGPGSDRVRRNRSLEPEFTDLAVDVFGDDSFDVSGQANLAMVIEHLWPRLVEASQRRQARLNQQHSR